MVAGDVDSRLPKHGADAPDDARYVLVLQHEQRPPRDHVDAEVPDEHDPGMRLSEERAGHPSFRSVRRCTNLEVFGEAAARVEVNLVAADAMSGGDVQRVY